MISFRSRFFFVLSYVSFIVNLALNRPTYQLNTLNPAYPSSNVVDGKRNDLRLYQCTSTGSGHELALWRVDLEQIQWIERIIVYARTDNKEWGIITLPIRLFPNDQI